MRRKILAAVCACVLATILVAGLYPFTSHPKNQVTWLGTGNGINFGHHGTMLSSGPFDMPAPAGDPFCTIELWLQPSFTSRSTTILNFYNPDKPLQFRLGQMGRDLFVSRQISEGHEQFKSDVVSLLDVFDQTTSVFITVTSGSTGTAVYVNGLLDKRSPRFSFTRGDLAAQILVLGNSALPSDSWSGQLRGLAVYSQELAPDQIAKHFESWTNQGRPDVTSAEKPVAIYLFAEHGRNIVHNVIPSGPDLYMPPYYKVLYQPFLVPPWKEFRSDLGYVKDITINIAGFVPFGLFFCAYLSSLPWIKKPRFSTILLGAVVSLTIEVLQAYLPTRDSGMTDIITNTLGTATGAFLYHAEITQNILRKVGLAAVPPLPADLSGKPIAHANQGQR